MQNKYRRKKNKNKIKILKSMSSSECFRDETDIERIKEKKRVKYHFCHFLNMKNI